MSILVYKQRFRHPNKKDTPGANYAHVRYIATRPRVLKNENMNHGLFGKLEPGAVTEFGDWKDVAKLSYANSKRESSCTAAWCPLQKIQQKSFF